MIDVVVLGSSPLMLLEAYFQSTQGKSVAIIDEASFPGGAWYVRDAWDLKNVEMGCHIFEKYDGRAYRFLEETLGFHMAISAPQPGTVRRRDFISQEKNELQYDTRCFFAALIRLKLTKAFPLFLRLKRTIWGILARVQYCYPEYGCGELVSRLVELNRQNGVNVMLNCSVRTLQIRYGNALSSCQTTTGPIEFKRIFVPSNLNGCTIEDGSKKVELPPPAGKVTHIVMHLRGNKKRDFSYLNILDEESCVARVSDAGGRNPARASLRAASRMVLCVQVKDSVGTVNENMIPLKILDELIRLQLVTPETSVEDYRLEVFITAGRHAKKTRASLDDFRPVVTCIETSDLTAGIATESRRWRSA